MYYLYICSRFVVGKTTTTQTISRSIVQLQPTGLRALKNQNMVGFSDLPTEALDEIARRVGPLDNVLCSAVCRPWRRALRTTRLRLLGRWPSRPHNIHICPSSHVVKVSPYESNTWEGARRCPVETVVDEEAARTRIIGCSSSYGWAVTVDDDTWAMYLLDPFTGRSFRLPPLTDPLPPVDQRRSEEEPLKAKGGSRRFWRHKFRKAALAPGRRLGTYAVTLVHSNGRGLSYLGPGATSWATLRLPKGMPHRYLDVIFHRGAFYTVSCYAELHAWVPDGDGGGMRARRMTNDPAPEQVRAVLTETLSRDGILMASSTEPRGYYDYYNNKDRWAEQYSTVRRYGETERRWLWLGNVGKMTILVGEGWSLCGPPRGDFAYGHSYRVQASASHWFYPYVPRLDHPA